LRLTIAILILGILIAISSSAALAAGRSLHPDNIQGWIASVQGRNHRAPQADAPRSQWIVQGTREIHNPDAPRNGWMKSSDNFRPVEGHYKDKDDFNSQIHYKYHGPDGQLAAVPEPSGLAALAGPSLAAILYWRKRRAA